MENKLKCKTEKSLVLKADRSFIDFRLRWFAQVCGGADEDL